MLNFNEIQKAKERLNDVTKKTNLIYSQVFSNECNNEVYIKPENLQLTGAYKLRGAYNKISKLSDEERQKGLIASSAGNHAQGVAYAAKKLGAKATIVMPKSTPIIKVESTKKLGADIILEGECYDEAYAKARQLEEQEGYTFIHPFNDLDIIAGQGTIGIEILEENKDIDYVLVPIGGGGLISGIATAVKHIKPSIKVIGVEPIGAMAMKKSIENGKLIELDSVKTIADGVAVKRPGDIPFSIVKKYVDDIITISEYEIMEAFLLLLENHKMVGENAGVLSLAASKKLNVKNKKIACVISGGNIDVLTISTLINRGLVTRGRIYCFSVELPNTPGELNKISKILSDLNANVIKFEHNRYVTYDRLTNVKLEATIETSGKEHIELINKKLKEIGLEVKTVH
ncbi:threonine ammonia-lyase [Abyssisolibacter fermentans]|uniref:threonine ammonia-lyase n=1 Tax=Abyssisolibacter fermentans TaxID=1766203 RepID=UPI0008354C45|nr:threonine ammonia-lyase [Abyssisolibacter fermentans]